MASLNDSSFQFLEFIGKLSLTESLRDLNAAAQEGIADLLELPANVFTVLEDYHIYCAKNVVGCARIVLETSAVEVTEVRQGFTPSRSENHLFESHRLFLSNSTSQIGDRNHAKLLVHLINKRHFLFA